MFLFTDMILLTEPRSKAGRREVQTRSLRTYSTQGDVCVCVCVCVQLVRYTVFRQPLFLHCLEVHSLPPSPKHCLTLVHSNSLHQLVAAHTLQASCVEERVCIAPGAPYSASNLLHVICVHTAVYVLFRVRFS